MESKENQVIEPRRGFLVRVAAIAAGIGLLVGPLFAGLAVLVDPLRRKRKADFVRITGLDAIPDDGLPHFFQVAAEQQDAWTRYPRAPIGAVYLSRAPGSQEITAFTATCPHAGCFIAYTAGDKSFLCPCHTSSFLLDGRRAQGDKEVSPRDMDRLDVEIRKASSGTQEVFVKFQQFQAGIHEKIPVA